jgi:hypothetical protein
MGDDLLERLRRENPVPERMPALPIEAVLARLDNEPPTAVEWSSVGPRRARRAIRALPVVASVAVVLAVVAVLLTVGDHGRSATPPTRAVSPPARQANPLLPRPVAAPHVDLFQLARDNVRDTPVQLFENNPEVAGATPAALWHQTAIASTVRRIKTFTVPGVGAIQYWVANTDQQGICTALRLPDGEWAGLQHDGRVAGSMPGCRPTREQLSRRGALLLDGFDYEQTTATGSTGQSWTIQYGAVSVPSATQVRETVNGVTTPVIDGRYFAIALPGGPAKDWGDNGHLVALNTGGRRVADEGKPLPGTLTTKCVGRYDVRRERIPHTHRTARIWKCRRYVKVVAK